MEKPKNKRTLIPKNLRALYRNLHTLYRKIFVHYIGNTINVNAINIARFVRFKCKKCEKRAKMSIKMQDF